MNKARIYKVVFLSAGVVLADVVMLLVLIKLVHGPVSPGSAAADMFPEQHFMLLPERDAFYYHFFVAAAFALQAGAVWFFRRRL
jgi:hypothetical protein